MSHAPTPAWYHKPGPAPHHQTLVIDEKTGANVAVIYHDEGGHKGTLIAAAPDMHLLLQAVTLGAARIEKWVGTKTGEVCVGGVRYSVPMPNDVPDLGGYDDLRAALREAIAKATEGAPSA